MLFVAGGGFADFLGDLLHHLRVFLEISLRGFAALADLFAVVSEPGTGLFDDVMLGSQVEDVAALADAFVVHDVELGFAEWRGDLILNYLHTSAVADDALALLDLADATDIHTYRSIKL